MPCTLFLVNDNLLSSLEGGEWGGGSAVNSIRQIGLINPQRLRGSFKDPGKCCDFSGYDA